jgi:hypothetical protein
MTDFLAFLVGLGFALSVAGCLLLIALAIWFSAQR